MIQHPNKYRRPNPAMLLTSSKAKANALAKGGSAPQLVGWWKMNEGTGTTLNDSSGNGYNLTFSGSAGNTWTTLPGHSATALAMVSGPTGFAYGSSPAPSQLQLNNVPCSFSAWFNAVNGGALLSSLDINNSFQGYRVGVIADKANELSFDFISNTPSGALQGGTNTGGSIVTGTTYHVVVTYDGSKTLAGVKCYINAVANTPTASSNTLTGPLSTTGPLCIGSVQGQFDFFGGKMCDFRIYSGVLSAAAVTALYTAGPA